MYHESHVVIECACDSKHREHISEVAMMLKGKSVCFLAQTIINVYNYFAQLKSIAQVVVLYREHQKCQLVIFHCVALWTKAFW